MIPPCRAYGLDEPVRFCAEEVRPGTLEEPPEFCEEEAVEGSDFCEHHDPDAISDRLEAEAERRRDEARERVFDLEASW